eukprot:4756861-Prymnesium_polylepis.1
MDPGSCMRRYILRIFPIECQTTSTRLMAPAGSARIVEALARDNVNSGRAKSRRPGAPLETQP